MCMLLCVCKRGERQKYLFTTIKQTVCQMVISSMEKNKTRKGDREC